MTTSNLSKLTARDDKLLRLAIQRLSPNEMALEMGGSWTPEKCVERVKALLASRNVYTPFEEEQLLSQSIQNLIDLLQNSPELLLSDARQGNVMIGYLREQGNSLARRQKLSAEAEERYMEQQTKRLVAIVEAGYWKARGALEERYPELELNEIDGVFQEGMKAAAEQYAIT